MELQLEAEMETETEEAEVEAKMEVEMEVEVEAEAEAEVVSESGLEMSILRQRRNQARLGRIAPPEVRRRRTLLSERNLLLYTREALLREGSAGSTSLLMSFGSRYVVEICDGDCDCFFKNEKSKK